MCTKNIFRVILAIAAAIFIVSSVGGHPTAFAEDAKVTNLPADGGEPGKDYMAYLNALKKRDGATIRKMAEVPSDTSDKELKEQMEMVSAITPSGQKIVSAGMKGSTATLNVTGVSEKKKLYGLIELQKKGDVWKITKEEWSESPKKKRE